MDEKTLRDRMLRGFLPIEKLPPDMRQTLAQEHAAFELSEIRKRMDRLLEILEKSSPN